MAKRDRIAEMTDDQRDQCYRALCANHLTSDVAWVVARLCQRVSKLESAYDRLAAKKRGK